VDFIAKNYKINKAENYIKTNNILFFFNGVNKNSNDWIHTEQHLKKKNFKYYKVFNKTTKKTLSNSIFDKASNTANGLTFLVKPELKTKNLLKNTVVKDLKLLLFILLAVKLNNKFYSASQVNKTSSFHYIDNKLVMYQFGIVHLKRFNALKFIEIM
jgi:hypothetical protein